MDDNNSNASNKINAGWKDDDDQNKNLMVGTDAYLNNISGELYGKERDTVCSGNHPPSNRYTTIDNNFIFGIDPSYSKDNINDSQIPENSEINSNRNTKYKNNEIKNPEKLPENNIKNDRSISDKILFNLKLIMLGDSGVGKTSILARYINNEFSDSLKCTISLENKFKVIDVGHNQYVKLNIWDTAGQEKYKSFTRSYYTDSQGVIIVFDLSNHDTFEGLEYWIKELKDYAPQNIEILIVGNKSDLLNERSVNEEEIKNFTEHKYLYFEVSAKDGNNISLAFDKLRIAITEKLNKEKENLRGDTIHDVISRKSKTLDEVDKNITEQKSKKCC